MPLDNYRVIEDDGVFYVNNPMWNETPARYYVGPYSETQAQEMANACNRHARTIIELRRNARLRTLR